MPPTDPITPEQVTALADQAQRYVPASWDDDHFIRKCEKGLRAAADRIEELEAERDGAIRGLIARTEDCENANQHAVINLRRALKAEVALAAAEAVRPQPIGYVVVSQDAITCAPSTARNDGIYRPMTLEQAIGEVPGLESTFPLTAPHQVCALVPVEGNPTEEDGEGCPFCGHSMQAHTTSEVDGIECLANGRTVPMTGTQWTCIECGCTATVMKEMP